MQVNGLNFGHDMCFVHFDDGICTYYEDLSRTIRKKFAGLDITSNRSSFEIIGAQIHRLKVKFPCNIWALTFNPSTYESMLRAFALATELFEDLKDTNIKDLWKSLLTEGFYNINKRIIIVEHSLSHLMSSYCTGDLKNDEPALSISIDGWSTSCFDLVGDLTKTTKINEIPLNCRLFNFGGAFYDQYLSRLFLGEPSLSVPGKIMGLACYGKTNLHTYEWIKNFWLEFINLSKITSYHDLVDEIKLLTIITEKQFPFLKEKGNAQSRNEDAQNFYATAQYLFSEEISNKIVSLLDQYNAKNLYYAGGCALSIVTNSRLLHLLRKKDKEIFIPPFANDSGVAYGAVCATYSFINQDVRRNANFPWIGAIPHKQTSNQFLRTIKSTNLNIKSIANELAEGKLIGWFEGLHAVGPRALGERSVFANPCTSGVRVNLNSNIKMREWYRPYGAIVDVNNMEEIFVEKIKSPFMLYEVPIKEEYRKLFDGCLSADGNCRIQTIDPTNLSHQYELLYEFRQITGYSCIINTSLNVGGKPIVSNYEDAYEDAKSMGLDVLVLDDKMIRLK